MASESDPPLALRRLIDIRCDQFEAAWAAGKLHRIEEIISEVPSEARGALLEELLHLELEFRWAAGQRPPLDEYLGRFPEEHSIVAKVYAEHSGNGPASAHSQSSLRRCRSAPANLLMGVLALQNGLLSHDELLAATTAWVQGKGQPLREVIRHRNLMSQEELDLLEALYAKYLQHHNYSLDQSLADLSSLGSVRGVGSAARRGVGCHACRRRGGATTVNP